jgi:hypothetical protein
VKKRFIIAGGGVAETELAVKLAEWAKSQTGMKGYCVRAFAEVSSQPHWLGCEEEEVLVIREGGWACNVSSFQEVFSISPFPLSLSSLVRPWKLSRTRSLRTPA